uniref:Uncharacterized protein n=1 Tax=Oryza glumipatula TaxID=40148 RepID=A0A0E0A3V7_9ORYZ
MPAWCWCGRNIDDLVIIIGDMKAPGASSSTYQLPQEIDVLDDIEINPSCGHLLPKVVIHQLFVRRLNTWLGLAGRLETHECM